MEWMELEGEEGRGKEKEKNSTVRRHRERRRFRMKKWEIEVVDKRITEISDYEFEQRLEELLNLLLRKEGILSTDGFAPNLEETACPDPQIEIR